MNLHKLVERTRQEEPSFSEDSSTSETSENSGEESKCSSVHLHPNLKKMNKLEKIHTIRELLETKFKKKSKGKTTEKKEKGKIDISSAITQDLSFLKDSTFFVIKKINIRNQKKVYMPKIQNKGSLRNLKK